MEKSATINEASDDQNSPSTEVSQICLPDLPTPLIHEFLFKMPIKSLMKFKCAWKSLSNILYSPDFATNYAKKSPYTTFLLRNPDDHLVRGPPSLRSLEISDRGEYLSTVFKPNVPGWSDGDMNIFTIVGSSNGLLCFVVYYNWHTQIVYICNPVRGGECVMVAQHDVEESEKYSEVEYAFGYCKSTHRFKVLKFTRESIRFMQMGQILTIGVDNTWRELDRVVNPNMPMGLSMSDPVGVNEISHKLLMDRTCCNYISTFNFEEEKMGRLSHPNGMVMDLMRTSLTSINSQLCIVDRSDDLEIVVWRMREYGVGASWIKDLVLDLSVAPQIQLQTPLCLVKVLESGEMLFSHRMGNSTISYNPRTREVTRRPVPCYGCIDYAPNFLALDEIIEGAHSSTVNV